MRDATEDAVDRESGIRRCLRAGLKGVNACLRPMRLSLVRKPEVALTVRVRELQAQLGNAVVRLGCNVAEEHVGWIETWLPAVKRLASSRRVEFRSEADRIVVEVDSVVVELTSDEELLMLCEVFHDGHYAHEQKRPMVVMDVGMNVGIASLYFATLPWVERVYGFEPFRQTYAIAQQNLSRNPVLARKIVTCAFGLGASDASQVCRYSFSRKGNMGPSSRSPCVTESRDAVDQAVELKRASVEVRKVCAACPDASLMLKIDVEGAESEILSDLMADGAIRFVDVLVMEWHYSHPREIVRRLVEHGFGVQIRGAEVPGIWMIHAVRSGE